MSHDGHGHAPPRSATLKLAVGALGVVYGDIGTSPLYSLKECFADRAHTPIDEANILGILSLFFWSLTMVVVAKYLTFIMRADNHGEGGILALLALVTEKADARHRRIVLIMLGLIGAALLYGDGMITPAISVLSAVEGLEVATDKFKPFVVPATVVILIALFLIQKRGTARVGAVFGPAMVVWFVTIAAVGIPWIVRAPHVLEAVFPHHAARYLVSHGYHGFLTLGAVVLCITGGEALYADMGHFGRAPIRLAWYAVAFPALLCNYFGQGALLLTRGEAAIDNPFYGLVSGALVYPMVVIATVATVVASQALISGAYSLTQQAVQLGYWPRVEIKHTSSTAEGQIYVPEINAALMIACVALVVGFRESSALAAAYGIAVTGTMSITTILFFVVARERFGWSLGKAGAICGVFLAIDFAFFASNLLKVLSSAGALVPIGIGAFMFTIMITWKRGRAALAQAMFDATLPLTAFHDDLKLTKPHRVKGTAVFMSSNPMAAPPVLLHHFKHNKVLHEQVICLSIATAHQPEVASEKRLETVQDLGDGVYQVRALYGFMQTPNAMEILQRCAAQGLPVDPSDTSFFLGRETLVMTNKPGMAGWRKSLFSYLSRNARPATSFFQIPPNRVVEFGMQVEL